ncbi:MAG: co-chaperone GroES [Ruminococcaceae bacterium]|nr:co-chaperone GroES [Oscillospiraceae bacterium]
MKIQPLFDKVVLKFFEAEETSKGGLLLASTAKEKPEIAEVVAVGPGGIVDGEKVEMCLTVGEKVIMSKYAGTTVKIDGEEFVIVKQSDILAKVE